MAPRLGWSQRFQPGEAAKLSSSGGASGRQPDQGIQDGGSTSTAPGGLASREPAETRAHVCPDARSGRDEACSFFKPRIVPVRALNDGSDTARIIVGRTAAPAAASAPDMPSGPQSSPSQKPVQENPSGAARAEQKSAEERPQYVSREPSKKPLKTARREKRQRNEWGKNDYPGRVDPWAARAENSAGTSGRAYAREASYGRRGFWD